MRMTNRPGVTFAVDYAEHPGITVLGSVYTPRELRYLRARLEGADLLRGTPAVCAHRIGHLTIRVDPARVAPYRPSAQSLADYVASAIKRQEIPA